VARFSLPSEMRRIVLLGASNLTLAFSRVAGLAAAGLGAGPVRLLAAAGHGRAYALPSRVLARRLPAIATCGLWRDLESEPGLATRALIADVGNDLAFGAPVEEVTETVGSCLERLLTAGSETIVIVPPVAGVERLSRARFALLRSILFPGREFDQSTIVRRLRRLSAAIRCLAEDVGARTAELDPAWLGGDGIHIRRRQRSQAWRSLLAGWRPSPAVTTLPSGLRWSWLRAERASLLALPLGREQPCRRFADGSTLACY
jgi:hypothetical protein